MEADPKSRLRELLAEVARHREALLQYRQSVYPEMVEMHKLRLRELYSQVRDHCAHHRLPIPPSIPPES